MENRISEIQITPIKPVDGLVSFVSIIFDNSLYLGSIGIFTRPQGGFRLTYPTRKSLNYSIPIFHPINKILSQAIEDAVVAKLERLFTSKHQ